MRVAYPYLRFSTPEQLEGDSIRRQTTKTRDWCARKGIALDTSLSFEDLGRSAFTGSHFNEGALGVFFSLVKDGTIKPGSYLVIESLDRFSRENPMTAAGRLFELVKAGITVVTVDDEREYSPESLGGSDSTAMLILVIKLSQAHAESVRKSQLIGPAWQKKKELARTEGRPLTSRGPEWLALENEQFIERWDRVEIVRRIFRETIEGYGRREIARRLNGTIPPVPTFRSDEKRKRPSVGWQTSSIAAIVRNRMVLGEYQPYAGTHRARNRRPDGEPIKDFYPRIIDDETFLRAQAALKDRRTQTSGRRGKTGAHILRGLAKCAECGGSMHIQNKGKPPKGGVYLRCDRHHRNAGCGNGRLWRVDYLEKRIVFGITSLDVEALSLADDADQEAKVRIDGLKAEVDDIKTRRRRLLSLVEGGDELASGRYKELGKELETKKRMLAEAEADKAATVSNVADRLSQAVALSNALTAAHEDDIRDIRIKLSALLRKIVSHIICDPEMGAIMILPQRPLWRVKIHGFGLRMGPEVVSVLLDEDVRDDLIEQFISFDWMPTNGDFVA